MNELLYLKQRLRTRETALTNAHLELARSNGRIQSRKLHTLIDELNEEIAGLNDEILSIEEQLYEQANN